LRFHHFALLTACGRQTIELPDLRDARSVVLLIEAPRRVEAHDFALPNRRVPVDGAGELTLLAYEEGLAAIGLREGSVDAFEGEDARRLPYPDRALRSSVSDDWRATAATESELFRSFRFAPEAPADCLARGGCYPSKDDRACARPCPQPIAPEAPRLPALPLPVLTPCPAGWVEVERSVTVCEPRFGEPVEPSCPSGGHPFLGGPCRAIGPPCPADGWPVPGAGTVVWVRAGASGSGTRADPFGTIDAGLAASPPGGVVAIARGRYIENVLLDRGRTLLGACAADTIVEGAITGADGSLRSLTIEGDVRATGHLVIGESSLRAGLEVAEGAEVDGDTVVVAGSAQAIAVAPNARVELRGSVIDAQVAGSFESATATLADTLVSGELRVAAGRLSLESVELHRGGGPALTSSASARIEARDVIVRGSGIGPAFESRAATLILTRTVVAGPMLLVENEVGGTLELAHVAHFASGYAGNSISSSAGALTARQLLIEGVTESAFSVEETNVLVSASTIRGTGRAVTAREGAVIRVEKSVVEDAVDYAFRIDGPIDGPGEAYRLEDVEVRRAAGGIRLLRDDPGRISRVALVELTGPAIFAEGGSAAPDTRIDNLSITGTRLTCDAAADDCAAVALAGGTIRIDRFRIGDVAGAAIRAAAESSVELSNGVIAGAAVGLAVFGSGRDPRDLLRTITFEDVPSPCAPCGE
jgi:hypothetical protein